VLSLDSRMRRAAILLYALLSLVYPFVTTGRHTKAGIVVTAKRVTAI